ncbi:MAG: FHA domain-containing protein [Bdellovibrionota bacterium]
METDLKAYLKVARGLGKDKEYLIEEGRNFIGRWDPDSGAFPEIDLEPVDEEAKVSRKHAVITRRGQEITIEDLGSLNGTFVNRGSRLEENNPVEIKNDDEVVIGKTFMVLRVVKED